MLFELFALLGIDKLPEHNATGVGDQHTVTGVTPYLSKALKNRLCHMQKAVELSLLTLKFSVGETGRKQIAPGLELVAVDATFPGTAYLSRYFCLITL
jgi:hypothetical protein